MAGTFEIGKYSIPMAVFLVVIMMLFIQSKVNIRKKKTSFSMPGYKMIYADQKGENGGGAIPFGKLLYSSKYDIQGKPDFIYQRRFLKKYCVVEIKSGEIRDEEMPHEGDMLQLAAYFLLVEDVYGKKPWGGRLVYRDYMFEIRNTAAIRKLVKQTMSRMRRMLKTGEEECQPTFIKCRHCVCRGTVCGENNEYRRNTV